MVEIERMEKGKTTIPTTCYDKKKMFAEMRRAIKQVLCGYSDNSSKGMVNLFEVMFPDSKIATSMELGRNKLKYIVNHILTEDLESADFFSVCIDKSLNKTTQNCEMGLVF